jgi:pimeloyl-ACP methyl ester carboxylesterase
MSLRGLPSLSGMDAPTYSMIPLLLGLAANMLAVVSCAPPTHAAPRKDAVVKTSGYVTSNGVSVYYEIHGTGEPLVVLHGGFGAIEMFGDNLDALAKHHQVIGIDLQGHGRTALAERAMSFDAMADDVVAVLDHVAVKKTDVMGYSLGGEVALVTAIRHPERVKRLVVVSAPFNRDGWHSQMTDGMAQISPAAAEPMKHTPMYELYARIAPKVQDWPRFLGAMGDLLRKPFDVSADVPKLPPTLIIVGDADGVRLTHAVEFFALLGGGQRDAGWDGKDRPASQLAILPGQTHYGIFMAPALVATIEPFLR